MIDISAIGATLTFTGSLSSVTFNDLSDSGAVIEFGSYKPLSYEYDLNQVMMVWHDLVSPEVSISFIPNSTSDRKMRALLLSSTASVSMGSVSDVCISKMALTIPAHNGGSKTTYTFKTGYLVGGSAALNVNSEGRLTSTPYRFVFKSVGNGKGSKDYYQTELCYNGSAINNVYYARVSSTMNARMIGHPVETGGQVFDQKYIEPERVNLRVKIPLTVAPDVVSKFYNILEDRSVSNGTTPYSIESKTESYDNLSLINISHEESPDKFDLIEYTLEFHEILFSSTNGTKSTADGTDSSMGTGAASSLSSTRPTA